MAERKVSKQERSIINQLVDERLQTQAPQGLDLQGLMSGIMQVCTGVLATAQGLQNIDRACPGICMPGRDDFRS